MFKIELGIRYLLIELLGLNSNILLIFCYHVMRYQGRISVIPVALHHQYFPYGDINSHKTQLTPIKQLLNSNYALQKAMVACCIK
jgi:hypothetical protein